MPILGKYCKAYPLHQLRQFPGWIEKPDNARFIRQEVDGEIVEVARQLTDAHYVYLQENLTVTDGILSMRTSSSATSPQSGSNTATAYWACVATTQSRQLR